MAVSPSYLTYVLDQFASFGEVVARRMFGGVGLYHNGLFIGAIDEDAVYLRVDDQSRAAYEERRMPAFRPVKSKPDLVMHGYFQLPPEILDDREELPAWLARAVSAAAATPPKTRRAKLPRRKAKARSAP